MRRHSSLLARHCRTGTVLAFGALCALALGGCNSSDPSSPADTGNLVVTITAVEGTTPSVAVLGPDGYQQDMTASGTLSGLVPGSYAVMGRPVTVTTSGAPVVYTATATNSPVIVSAGATATASVTYTVAEPGKVASVEVSPDPAILRLTVRPTLQLTATPKDAAGQPVAGRGVTWQSHDPGRASVSETGVVSQLDSGFVTILAWIETTLGPAPDEASLGFTHVVLAPDDATALCMDGSFSRNSTRAAACSAHQGVRVWLDDPPPVSPGALAISTSTAGPSPDPDGYTVLLDGVEHGAIGVSAAATLSGLTPGPHQLGLSGVASNCTVTGDNPRAVTIMAGAPATVTFAVTCSLPPAGGPTVLWVGIAASEGPRLLGYTVAQLAASTGAPPAIALTLPPGTGAVTGLAFDPYGNLWVSDSANNTVSKYTAQQLATSGSVTPAVVLSSTRLPDDAWQSIIRPHGLAFDASGNLWVANSNPETSSSIVEFTPGHQAASGAPMPLWVVKGDYCGHRCRYFHWPYALAFDTSDNLWVSDPEREVLLMYPPDQLQLPPLGSSRPKVTLADSGQHYEQPNVHGTDTGLDFPAGLAFDAVGNLWVSLGVTNKVVMFTPSQLTFDCGPYGECYAEPEPTITLSGETTSLNGPRGLAFDASGSLWVANLGGNAILEFTASQLGSSGAPAPHVVIPTSAAPAVLAFNPRVALNLGESSR